MKRAMRAEWVKTWSDPGTGWLLGALVALSVAVGAAAAGAARCPAAGCGQDPARISLTGVYLAQAAAALAGVAALGSEYGTAMMRVSLTAVPRRGRLLAAKAVVLAVPVLGASVLAIGASMLAGWLVLPGHGFTAAHGFDLAGGPMWRAAGCAALYLMLVAVLGLGVTAVVRDSAAAIGIVLGLLYLFPVAAALMGDPAVARRLEQIGPLSAGMDSVATSGLQALPLTPWQGLGVAALWAAGALALGGVLLRARRVMPGPGRPLPAAGPPIFIRDSPGASVGSGLLCARRPGCTGGCWEPASAASRPTGWRPWAVLSRT